MTEQIRVTAGIKGRLFNLINLFLAIVFVSNLGACTSGEVSYTTAEIQAKNHYLKNARIKIDSAKTFLKEGRIILRRGNDVISEIFSLLNINDRTFSHCGIVMKEEGKWMVYHSIGGEDNPDEKMRRDPYEYFVQPESNMGMGICDIALSEMQLSRLRHVVDSFYRRQIPFDMQFSLESDDRFYCAEMLYKAYNYVYQSNQVFPTTTHRGLTYVSTDNLFVNKHVNLLCRIIY